jgi:hypothetical protein
MWLYLRPTCPGCHSSEVLSAAEINTQIHKVLDLRANLYKHLQGFDEICATLMISGMNHETLKWKAFPFSLTGWTKQWYKLHVSSCHGSWVILKDQFYFTFFPLSKIIDLRNEFLNFAQKEGESLGAARSRYNQLALLGPELSIPDAMFM